MSSAAKRILLAWGRLLRLPNLFTVPGDVIAGAAWGGGGKVAPETGWAVFAVLFLYSGGLFLNDYFDREIDLKERPERPIPAGQVSAGLVLAVGCIALLLGVSIARWGSGWETAVAAAVVSVFVLLYDGGLKRNRVLGSMLMGLCRGGAVMIGGLAARAKLISSPLIVAVVTALYAAAVTLIASDEHRGVRPGRIAYLPVLVIFAGMAVSLKTVPISFVSLVGYGLFIFAGIDGTRAALQVNSGIYQIPVFIGRLIRLMIVIQAAWTMFVFGEYGMVEVLYVLSVFAAFKIASDVTARQFYAS